MGYPFHLSQTFIENWSDALLEASIRHESIPLSYGDVMAIGAYTPEFRAQFGIVDEYELSDEFVEALDEKISLFPSGAFPRLNYCSWKETTLLNQPAFTSRDVMSIIVNPNYRIAAGLAQPAMHVQGSILYLREWCEIPRWSEFRIFMKNRKIRGVSQYYSNDTFPEITDNLSQIRSAVYEFCVYFHKQSHMDTVVADIFLNMKDNRLKACLIELNPFTHQTASCLYNWKNGGNFDGSLRFKTQDGIFRIKMEG